MDNGCDCTRHTEPGVISEWNDEHTAQEHDVLARRFELRVSEVEEWGTLIEEIASHLKASCSVE